MHEYFLKKFKNLRASTCCHCDDIVHRRDFMLVVSTMNGGVCIICPACLAKSIESGGVREVNPIQFHDLTCKYGYGINSVSPKDMTRDGVYD